MSKHVVRTRPYGAIESTLTSIAEVATHLGDRVVCVLHCMQPHRGNYYRQLAMEFDVQIVVHRGAASVLRAVFGAPALVVMERPSDLHRVFARIGEQALAGLYVIQRCNLAPVADAAKVSVAQVMSVIESDPSRLIYQVDEDSAVGDEQVVEIIEIGAACPQVLREAVGLLAPTDT